MIKLNLAIYDGDVQVINFNTISELSEYLKELKMFDCIWLATEDGEDGEILITENLDTLIKAVENSYFNLLADSPKNFYVQEYQSFEDAYAVALDMREGHEKCYDNGKKPCLVHVPENQISWFESEYGYINDDDFETDGADWHSLKKNIFGDNYRFINYNGNSNSLLDGFWLGYSSGGNSTINTKFFLGTCLIAINESTELEFFEISSNIKTIYESICEYIKLCESKY